MNLVDIRYLALLPLLPALYWLLPRSRRLAGLSLLSLAAVAWFSLPSALALAGVAAGTYGVYRLQPARGWVVALGVTALVLVFLAYRSVPLMPGLGPLVLVGLAFYGLKAIRVLIDRHREPGRAPVSTDLFLAYMLFFPTILVGPIHGLSQFQADWRQQALSVQRISSGLERMFWGYVKLVLLGAYLVNFKMVFAIADIPADQPRLLEYLNDMRYGLHLYFTFAGASDIAIGFAALLGFRIEENFHHPFAASSIAEFWRRWHMSLSSWARHYVYAPLVAVTRHHATTLVLTMGLIGAWHELSARYLVWGAYHGLGLVVHHRWAGYTDRFDGFRTVKRHPLYRALAVLLTFHFVMLGFGIARAESSAQILGQLRVLAFGSP